MEHIKDYIIWIAGVLFATWQLVEEVKKGKSKIKISILSIAIILFGWLGVDQINRINKAKTEADGKIDSLINDLNSLVTKSEKDSIAFKSFEDALKAQFNIIRDSLTNKPISTAIFNTNIKKAEKVYIGN